MSAGLRVLSLDELRGKSPSIFQTQPHETTSAKFDFVPTIALIEDLQKQGFKPYRTKEQRVRNESREGYQKHEVEFFYGEPALGDNFFKIALRNAHDGTSSFQINTGIFRLCCYNGLTRPIAQGEIKIRHSGYCNEAVSEAITLVLDEQDGVFKDIHEWNSIQTTQGQKEAYLTAAKMLRWDGNEAGEISNRDLDWAHRINDREETNLYMTMNRVQENLIRGGFDQRKQVTTKYGRAKTSYRKVREVKGIEQSMNINKALWTLTQEFSKLVKEAA